jgi:hypothetical protein
MPDGKRSRSLCIFCGEEALRINLCTCSACGRQPQTAHEVAYAMAYTDVVLDDEGLDLITDQMRRGRPGPKLEGETYEYFLGLANGIDLDQMFAGIAKKEGHLPH